MNLAKDKILNCQKLRQPRKTGFTGRKSGFKFYPLKDFENVGTVGTCLYFSLKHFKFFRNDHRFALQIVKIFIFKLRLKKIFLLFSPDRRISDLFLELACENDRIPDIASVFSNFVVLDPHSEYGSTQVKIG